MFFKINICPFLPDEDMSQRGVEGPSLDTGQPPPSSNAGFLHIASNNQEHLNPREKKEDTERFAEAPPSSDGVRVHLASEGT